MPENWRIWRTSCNRMQWDTGIQKGPGENGIIVAMNTLDRKENVVVETGDSFDTVKAFESLKDEERLNVDKKRINICLNPFEWRIYKACGEL